MVQFPGGKNFLLAFSPLARFRCATIGFANDIERTVGTAPVFGILQPGADAPDWLFFLPGRVILHNRASGGVQSLFPFFADAGGNQLKGASTISTPLAASITDKRHACPYLQRHRRH